MLEGEPPANDDHGKQPRWLAIDAATLDTLVQAIAPQDASTLGCVAHNLRAFLRMARSSDEVRAMRQLRHDAERFIARIDDVQLSFCERQIACVYANATIMRMSNLQDGIDIDARIAREIRERKRAGDVRVQRTALTVVLGGKTNSDGEI